MKLKNDTTPAARTLFLTAALLSFGAVCRPLLLRRARRRHFRRLVGALDPRPRRLPRPAPGAGARRMIGIFVCDGLAVFGLVCLVLGLLAWGIVNEAQSRPPQPGAGPRCLRLGRGGERSRTTPRGWPGERRHAPRIAPWTPPSSPATRASVLCAFCRPPLGRSARRSPRCGPRSRREPAGSARPSPRPLHRFSPPRAPRTTSLDECDPVVHALCLALGDLDGLLIEQRKEIDIPWPDTPEPSNPSTPPEDAWHYLADLRSLAEWDPSVKRVELVTGQPGGAR